MKSLLLSTFCLLTFAFANAQFTTTGKIEYERKVNMHKQLEDNEWMKNMLAQIPKFQTHYFNLSFAPGVTYYENGRKIDQQKMPWGDQGDTKIQVHTDFKANRATGLKEDFEQKFLVQDTVRKMQWVIKDEVRIIANYKCRKAVGKILDSVYVVAFYTDDIPVSGGPEMFAGLPGMILELAIPRLYSTWTATTIDLAPIAPTTLAAPTTGKPLTHKDLYEKISASTKQWGSMAALTVWWTVL